MTRIYQNFLVGELDAAISDSDTSISSPELADMEAVASPRTMMMVLDPEGSAGDPEIVTVTAHTASATTATVTRGSQGTTARAHASSTVWRHGPLASDVGYAGMVEIQSQTLGSAAASISFSSIPATYRDLALVFQGRSSHTTTTALTMRINGDSGSNYDRQLVRANGASASSQETLAQAQVQILAVPGTDAAAGLANSCEVIIPNYANTTWQKSFTVLASDKRATATGNYFHESISCWWRSTAAISSITLTPGSGNIVAGSIATLYGRGRL